MSGSGNKGFLDQVADFLGKIIFLFIIPVSLAVILITTLFSKNKENIYFAWLLIPYIFIYSIFLREKRMVLYQKPSSHYWV